MTPKIGLVTDSSADIPAAIAAQYGIEIVPAIVVIDGKQHIDGKDISREEFYNCLPSYKNAPSTAAPSIGNYQNAYRKLFEVGCQHVISMHIAEKLTSMVNVARQAAADFPGQVTVLESGSLSLGVGFQVLAAAEAIADEYSLDEALATIQSTRKRLRVYAALDTIEYVRRSGRVPAAVAALGGLLHIRPVVELVEGEVKPLGGPRTTRQATEKLHSLLTALGPLERLAILHTNAPARAKDLLETLMAPQQRQTLPRDILMVNVTTVIGTHIGPNGLGVAAVKR